VSRDGRWDTATQTVTLKVLKVNILCYRKVELLLPSSLFLILMDYYNYDTLCYPTCPLVEWPQAGQYESEFYQHNPFLPDHTTSRIKQEELGGFQSYPYHQQRGYDAFNLLPGQQLVRQSPYPPYPPLMLPPYAGISTSQLEQSELEMVDQMNNMMGVTGVVEDLVGHEYAYKEDDWGAGCKRRRSQSAPVDATPLFPVPIPVPNLTKKSRGRRVPTMSSLEDVRSAASGAGRKRQSSGGKTARMYMCEVNGCGKCFARGEHLKRHVRSIHTYEKREVFIS
jgi:hypothetical protein